MNIIDFFSLTGSCFAILMLGSVSIRLNLWLYAIQTFFMALSTLSESFKFSNSELAIISLVIIIIKAFFIPIFLNFVIEKIKVKSDSGLIFPVPIGMHLGILFLGFSNLFTLEILKSLPEIHHSGNITAGISLLFTGMLFMLLRKIAVSQIIGFLTLENGIFLLGVSITHSMPLIIDLGVMLDILVAIMICGLFIFKISSSFEHIDVTQLNELTES